MLRIIRFCPNLLATKNAIFFRCVIIKIKVSLFRMANKLICSWSPSRPETRFNPIQNRHNLSFCWYACTLVRHKPSFTQCVFSGSQWYDSQVKHFFLYGSLCLFVFLFSLSRLHKFRVNIYLLLGKKGSSKTLIIIACA